MLRTSIAWAARPLPVQHGAMPAFAQLNVLPARWSVNHLRGLRFLSSTSTPYATDSEAVPIAPDAADSFLQGNGADYIDEMYRIWRTEPQSVHASWQTYFRNMEDRQTPAWQAFQPPPGLISLRYATKPPMVEAVRRDLVADSLKLVKLQMLVRAYQRIGHHHAKLDPLGIHQNLNINDSPDLNPASYGFTDADMNQEFTLGPSILPCFVTDTRKSLTLREIIATCKSLYCSTYGVEFDHITDRAKAKWLCERVEVEQPIHFLRQEKLRILDGLLWATTFERMLAVKAPNDKRFGLDGAEALAPAILSLVDRSADVHGVEDVIIGSCHRGRLTMMGSVYGKPYEAIFAEFAGQTASALTPAMTSDVKSHLGYHGERTTAGGRQISMSLLPNPSHLETVDPVSAGKTFAAQRLANDAERRRVMGLTLHGDAAFAGQGVVYETLNMSNVPMYDIGGTVRIIVNNQLGFTTNAWQSRSTRYCSDIAKFIEAPIFHVNGDDVEAVVFFSKLAADFRAAFQTDCFLDIVCYRRYGHQELDLPNLTQPLMYEKIASHPVLLDQYLSKLVTEGSITHEEFERQLQKVTDHLNQRYLASKDYKPVPQPHPRAWKALASPEDIATKTLTTFPTAVEENVLKNIAQKVTTVPSEFESHKSLRRILATRKTAFDGGTVDWALAEAFAFGSLCLEGHHVRVTGQDVQRGTFAHRHAVLHDQKTDEPYTPLDNLSQDQARFSIANSPLSEYAPIGFEYGFTLADPTSLAFWEAQFGDFTNNMQVVIDNLIATAEAKWMDRSGVVLSLPHGYDGQGPEHSSARLERYLMLGNEATSWPADTDRQHQDCNLQVVYITSPANYFHVLRRQIQREFRKPLVIFFSKSLLRHPLTVSDVSEFTGSSMFCPVLVDPEHGRTINDPESISRLVLCTGQVYAALRKHREIEGIRDTAISRIEELHPFPFTDVQRNLNLYRNTKTIVWAQEEPYNGGAWHHVRDRIETILRRSESHRDCRILYAGRPQSAAVAVGIKSLHEAEQKKLLEDVFSTHE